VGALVAPLALVLAACSSSGNESTTTTTLSVCAQAAQLKTAVDNLKNVDVVKNGTTSASVAVADVKTDAKDFADAADAELKPETDALTSAVDALEKTVDDKEGAAAVLTATGPVATAFTNLQTKVSSTQDSC
jgi:hypothetical protein